MHKQFPRVYILAFFGVSCFTKVDTLLFVSGFQFFVFFFCTNLGSGDNTLVSKVFLCSVMLLSYIFLKPDGVLYPMA